MASYRSRRRSLAGRGRTCSGEPASNASMTELAMVFSKQLLDGIRRGRIRCSIRFWTRPHVKPGGRYAMDEGEIHVDSIDPIRLADITPALARESGFSGVADLMKTASP